MHPFLALASLFAAPPALAAFPDCTTSPLNANPVCDMTKDPITRATALIGLFNTTELIANTVNQSPGVARLGLPAYQWWNEALVCVSAAPSSSFL